MECKCEIDIDCWTCMVEGCEFSMVPNEQGPLKCHECKNIIETGDVYRKITGTYEGEPDTHRVCRSCSSAMDVMFKNGVFIMEGLWQDIEDHIEECEGEIPESCISKLEPQARERVLEIIQKIIGE